MRSQDDGSKLFGDVMRELEQEEAVKKQWL